MSLQDLPDRGGDHTVVSHPEESPSALELNNADRSRFDFGQLTSSGEITSLLPGRVDNIHGQAENSSNTFLPIFSLQNINTAEYTNLSGNSIFDNSATNKFDSVSSFGRGIPRLEIQFTQSSPTFTHLSQLNELQLVANADNLSSLARGSPAVIRASFENVPGISQEMPTGAGVTPAVYAPGQGGIPSRDADVGPGSEETDEPSRYVVPQQRQNGLPPPARVQPQQRQPEQMAPSNFNDGYGQLDNTGYFLPYLPPQMIDPPVVPRDRVAPGQGFNPNRPRENEGFDLAFPSVPSSYYPSNRSPEGGYKDMKGHPLRTLQDFIEGKADYVSVAMDLNLIRGGAIPYGTEVRIPELEREYNNGKPIIFKVVDNGPAFLNRGTGRIDICTRDYNTSLDERVNRRQITLKFRPGDVKLEKRQWDV